jgi:hypothetical protein
VPQDAYRAVAAWTSPGAWFDALMDDLASPEGEAARRAARISPSSYLAVAKADRDAADYATGRGLTTSNATAAARAHVKPRTVERARALLARRGFAVTIVTGRYLTNDERAEARALHGRVQLRAASVRALTLPRGPQRPVKSGDLPTSRRDVRSASVPNMVNATRLNGSSPVVKTKTTRAVARETAAPRPQPRKKKIQNRSARPLRVQLLAAKLSARTGWSWIAPEGRHIGAICNVLIACGITGKDWSAAGLVSAMNQHTQRAGSEALAGNVAHSPTGYFRSLLRATLSDPETAVPDLTRYSAEEAERQAQRAAQAAQRHEDAEKRKQIAAQADEIAGILAAMRADQPVRLPRRRQLTSTGL